MELASVKACGPVDFKRLKTHCPAKHRSWRGHLRRGICKSSIETHEIVTVGHLFTAAEARVCAASGLAACRCLSSSPQTPECGAHLLG